MGASRGRGPSSRSAIPQSASYLSLVTCILPPPDAIGASQPFFFFFFFFGGGGGRKKARRRAGYGREWGQLPPRTR